MKRISNMTIGEGVLVDIRAICRDPNWLIRISIFYDALPLTPLPDGISVVYVEKIKRNSKAIFKIFHPKINTLKDIPMLEWPAIHEINAVPVAITNFLEPTLDRAFHECLPEFPCRICKLRNQEKHDVCIECNRILSYFMGKCLKQYPMIHKMKIREQLIKRLGKISIDEYSKNI